MGFLRALSGYNPGAHLEASATRIASAGRAGAQHATIDSTSGARPLGTGLSTWFEQSVPYDSYEYGMHDVIRTGSDGYVNAPQGPGLGYKIDWDAMKAATIHRLDSREIG